MPQNETCLHPCLTLVDRKLSHVCWRVIELSSICFRSLTSYLLNFPHSIQDFSPEESFIFLIKIDGDKRKKRTHAHWESMIYKCKISLLKLENEGQLPFQKLLIFYYCNQNKLQVHGEYNAYISCEANSISLLNAPSTPKSWHYQ